MKDTMITEEDYPVWNGYLYHLQEEAPRPRPVYCMNPLALQGRPPYFGDEYHGAISREEGDALCKEEGNFLIRESRGERGRYTLVLRILGAVKNFKLYWENGELFVGDKRFNDIADLVEDGLITMYVEEKAHDYIQNMSKNTAVYLSINRTKQLLSRPMSMEGNQMAMPVDRRMSPRREPVVHMNEGQNSPRHAHNGRNTEEAALPYSHHPHQAVMQTQFHNPAYIKSRIAEEECTKALENKLQTTNMLTEGPVYPRGVPSSASYYNQPVQQERSMIQSLMSGGQFHPGQLRNPPGLGQLGGGGTKKTLTPTSSDERKRTKAKKIATEESMMQQYEDCNPRVNIPNAHVRNGSPMRNGSPLRVYDHRRSPSNSSASTDSEGRRRNQAPPQYQNKGLPLNNYINQPARSQQHSPMHRNNSDPSSEFATPYLCPMSAQHMQTNVAHVRQLSSGSTSGSSVISGNSAGSNGSLQNPGPTPLPRCREPQTNGAGFSEKIMLDANDNQMVPRPDRQHLNQPHHSPSRSRQSPNRQGYDSSGHEVIPAKTFHQLKMFQRRLEEASDDDMKREAKDEVTTLRGQRKTPVRLTRSNTTTAMLPGPRPSSGRTPPRPPPRDMHYRQRSEPVELLSNLSPRKTNYQNEDVQPIIEHAAFRQIAPREDLRQQMTRRNWDQQTAVEQSLLSQLRAGSTGSCNSSISNVSSMSSSTQHHQEVDCSKHPDSISHVSSEDWTGEERESSPSPHSTSQRSCSSDDNSGSGPKPRASRIHHPRQNHVTSLSTDVIWQQRQAEERANRLKSSPLASVSNPNYPQHHHGERDDVLSALPQGSKGDVGRPRISSDTDTMPHTRMDPSTKPRHHSETSSEEGSPRHKEPPSPITALHKPLQRRATTGCDSAHKKDLERHLARANGIPSPVKSPKKPAQRSNSGPSPRKNKKSPEGAMSPRIHHISHQRSLSSPRVDGVPYYDKEHVFKSHTYRGLQWCEYCGNFMWGIIQQGVQCRDCGLNVHKQCSKLVPGDCQPAFKHVKKVFGIDLTALVKLHGTEIPIVVDMCIEEIERRGITSEGIYRISGFHDDVQELKLSFDQFGSDVDLSVYDDINIVAGGLKLYLRELPVPLIPYNLYSRFINAARLSHDDGKLEAIRTALDVMPPAHLQTLKHIIHHLTRICDHQSNQMNSHNLATVFGPTMLRPPEKDAMQARFNLNDVMYQKDIVETMIDNVSKLFRQSHEVTGIRETHNL